MKYNLTLLCCLLFLLIPSFAQNQTVSGKITDAKDDSPVAGATVKVKGSKVAVVSQSDGSFSITSNGGKKLIISHVGYADKEVSITGSTLNVSLSQLTQSLNEVVVYGTSIKRNITGSVVKISAKDINNTPATSFESAIQGRAAGVLVQQQNGKLGQGINIRIRGSSSVSAGNEPLYVVDGVPVITSDLSNNGATTNPLADLNMNDIESLDILKDASASAIYLSII